MDKLFEREVKLEEFGHVYYKLGETFNTYTIKRDAFNGLLKEITNYCKHI